MVGRVVRALVATLVIAAACSSEPDREAPREPGTPPGPTRLTIGYSRLRISLPVFVAEQQGIFRRHGLQTELVMYDTAQPLMQALVEGRVRAAGYTALPITYNGMIRSHTKLYFLTAMVEDQEHRISYLLRRRGDTAIGSVGDLRGRNVGILPTVAYRAWLTALLEDSGVDPGEVTIQQIAPAMQLQALRSGGVDALFTNDPAATSAIAEGIAEPVNDFVEVPRALGEPFLFGSFNVRKDWADAHRDEVARLAAALDEAVDFVSQHPADAKRAMRAYLPDAFRDHVDRYPDARYLRSDQVEEAAFTRAADQCRQRGIIPEALSLTGLVYTGRGR